LDEYQVASSSGGGSAGAALAGQRERCVINMELLRTIFQDYTEEELSKEIFTLNEVSQINNAKPKDATS